MEWPLNYNSPQKLKTERCWMFGGGVEGEHVLREESRAGALRGSECVRVPGGDPRDAGSTLICAWVTLDRRVLWRRHGA